MKYRPLLLPAVAAVLVSCGSLPVPQQPEARAFVAAELAALTPAGDYAYTVIDFADADETARGLRAGGVELQSTPGGTGFELGRRVTGDDAPPQGRFVGSTEHLRLRGAGSIRLRAPAIVLGMHVVLPAGQVRAHRRLMAETEAGLLVTGIDRGGRETATVRFSPAWAAPGFMDVATEWQWVDLSLLGEVAELELTFESPLDAAPVLLVDNLTVSEDFRPDDAFITVAVLPATGPYVEDAPEVLRAQTRFLAANGPRSVERIVFVTHLGGLVPTGADEETWDDADAAMSMLDRSVPWGVALSPAELEDPDDPEAGSPLFLDYFGPERFETSSTWGGASPDEYSSWHRVDTPAGPLVVIQLAVDPAPETLEWAQAVLDDHRGVPVIVTTGSYLTATGRLEEPVLQLEPESMEPVTVASGLWDTLVWPNEQIVLALCGPPAGEQSTYARLQVSPNRSDQPVLEMMVGWPPWAGGADGYLRLLRFYPDRNLLRAHSYSPLANTFRLGPDNDFSVPLSIAGRTGR